MRKWLPFQQPKPFPNSLDSYFYCFIKDPKRQTPTEVGRKMGAGVAGKKMAKHQVHNAPPTPSTEAMTVLWWQIFFQMIYFPVYGPSVFFFKGRCWFTFVIQNMTDCMNQIGAQSSVSAMVGCVSKVFMLKDFQHVPGGITRGRKNGNPPFCSLKDQRYPQYWSHLLYPSLYIGRVSVWPPLKWQGFYSLWSLAMSFMYLEFCFILYE